MTTDQLSAAKSTRRRRRPEMRPRTSGACCRARTMRRSAVTRIGLADRCPDGRRSPSSDRWSRRTRRPSSSGSERPAASRRAARHRHPRSRRLQPLPVRRADRPAAVDSSSTIIGVGLGTAVGLVAAYFRGCARRRADARCRRDAGVPADRLRCSSAGRRSARSCGCSSSSSSGSPTPHASRGSIRGAALRDRRARLRQGRRGDRRAAPDGSSSARSSRTSRAR